MTYIKQGDKFPLTLTVNHDLTGATTRLLVRHLARDGVLEELAHTKVGSTVTFALDGLWARGRHFLEVEITQAGEVRTAPSQDAMVINIIPDLDTH